jgi:hypothetical protein
MFEMLAVVTILATGQVTRGTHSRKFPTVEVCEQAMPELLPSLIESFIHNGIMPNDIKIELSCESVGTNT